MSHEINEKIVTVWKYGNAEFDLNLASADDYEAYNDALKVFDEGSATEPENDREVVRAYCNTFREFFDRLFGEGASLKLFGAKDNSMDMEDAYMSLVGFADTQVKAINARRLRMTGKHHGNRPPSYYRKNKNR